VYALGRFVLDKKRPTIISLLGIHTAGKTSIGQRLALLGIPYHFEIGNDLIKRVDFTSPGAVEWFDREILKREVERDKAFLQDGVSVVGVETWHVGNAAYAKIRTPHLMERYQDLFQNHFPKYNPLFFFLDISEETFRQRANKPVPLGVEEDVFVFYQKIKENILSLFEEHSIDHHVIDANQRMDKVVEDISDILASHEILPREYALN